MSAPAESWDRAAEPESESAPVHARPDTADAPALDATSDSITVAGWTMVSRVTGVAKIVAIGAVLGPTFLGNTFQFTNSLPNLIYYGLLAGSLFSSLLVPALVSHIDAHDRRASERVAGGFLGLTLLALAVATPVALAFGPAILRMASLGGESSVGAQQEHVGRLLILMFAPQLFLYAVVGTASASMNAHRRFALAAAAPALENIGLIAVLAATAVAYPTRTDIGTVPTGMLVLLGVGSTAAVALHASAQWWGAHRAGVTLRPRRGWRDPEVRVVVRRALPSLAQAGLVAVQVMTLLALADRVPGGVTAFQISLNFYFLAVAIGATPVALSLLPRLSRMHALRSDTEFRDTLVRGFSLGFFIAIPAAVAYLALARPLARAMSVGRMNTPDGVELIAGSLAALSVAVVAQTVFMIATYASYARLDTRSPLRAMVVQAVACIGLAGFALLVHGAAVLLVLGAAFSISILLAALHLTRRLRADLVAGTARLAPSASRIAVGAVAMVGPAVLTAALVRHVADSPLAAALSIIAAAAVGFAVFIAVQVALRTPEVAWLGGAFGQLRSRARGTLRTEHV